MYTGPEAAPAEPAPATPALAKGPAVPHISHRAAVLSLRNVHVLHLHRRTRQQRPTGASNSRPRFRFARGRCGCGHGRSSCSSRSLLLHWDEGNRRKVRRAALRFRHGRGDRHEQQLLRLLLRGRLLLLWLLLGHLLRRRGLG